MMTVQNRDQGGAKPSTQTLEGGDATHDWFILDFIGYECCRRCGIVRRSDRQNKPCRGAVKIGLRDD